MVLIEPIHSLLILSEFQKVLSQYKIPEQY